MAAHRAFLALAFTALTTSAACAPEANDPEPAPTAAEPAPSEPSASVATSDANAPAPASASSASAGAGKTGIANAAAQPVSPGPGASAEATKAIADAYAALTAGERERVGSVISAIDARLSAAPNDGRINFYAGTMRLWRLMENGLDPFDALAALDRLKRARELLPNDFRVTGFYGVMQVSVGRTLGNKAQIEAGFATHAQAIEQDPAYGYFLRASSTMFFPGSDPQAQTTVTDLTKLAEACRYPAGDAEVAYRYPTEAESAADKRPRVCLNDALVPHVWEGVFMAFAEAALRTKGWGAPRARALYRSVQTSPNYEDWPFKPELEARLKSADERAALYADANPANDPPLWGTSRFLCVGCHQARPRD